jgi:HD-like signal output (HDOD) protein
MIEAHTPAYTLEPAKRAAEPAPPSHPSTPNFINDIAAGKVELPTIPRVVQQLIAALRDPDVDTRKVGEALAQDPVLSAKVLRWRTRRSSAASARWRRSTRRWR